MFTRLERHGSGLYFDDYGSDRISAAPAADCVSELKLVEGDVVVVEEKIATLDGVDFFRVRKHRPEDIHVHSEFWGMPRMIQKRPPYYTVRCLIGFDKDGITTKSVRTLTYPTPFGFNKVKVTLLGKTQVRSFAWSEVAELDCPPALSGGVRLRLRGRVDSGYYSLPLSDVRGNDADSLLSFWTAHVKSSSYEGDETQESVRLQKLVAILATEQPQLQLSTGATWKLAWEKAAANGLVSDRVYRLEKNRRGKRFAFEATVKVLRIGKRWYDQTGSFLTRTYPQEQSGTGRNNNEQGESKVEALPHSSFFFVRARALLETGISVLEAGWKVEVGAARPIQPLLHRALHFQHLS